MSFEIQTYYIQTCLHFVISPSYFILTFLHPGFTATYCTYVVEDVDTGEIIAFYVMEKSQVKSLRLSLLESTLIKYSAVFWI